MSDDYWSREPTAEDKARWAAYTEKRERQRASRAKREVVIGRQGTGYCRWCAKPIIGTKGKYLGKPDPRRSWCRDANGHSPCLHQWNLHSRSEVQFNWLVDEHGERCNGCRVEKPMRVIMIGSYEDSASDLQVDHIEPLWLVALTVPPEDRRRYFGPENLQLLCGKCHKSKTRREAAERAQMKRQAAFPF